MNNTDLRRTLEQLRLVTKYGMTSILILMTVHCGLLFLGYDIFLIHILFWVFALLIGYKLSCVFKLCWVHKLSVVYSMAVILLIAMKAHSPLGEYDLHIARGVMCCIGVMMIGLNIWKTLQEKRYRSC